MSVSLSLSPTTHLVQARNHSMNSTRWPGVACGFRSLVESFVRIRTHMAFCREADPSFVTIHRGRVGKAKLRMGAMTNQKAQFNLNDGSEILINDTPDETLEAVACSGPLSGRCAPDRPSALSEVGCLAISPSAFAAMLY
jgi:hypothetical protein